MLEQSRTRNINYERAISRNAQRLYTFTNDILESARIESRTFKIEKSSFDLNKEIEDAIRDTTTRYDWKSLESRVQIIFDPKESLIVWGDKRRIYQAVSNLLINALKFTENGIITIAVEKKNQTNEVLVTITDTGTGIDEVPRLFVKFASKSKSGTGLGLFITKAIVEGHGGRIEGYNNVGSTGAAFRFTLPLTV